MPRDEVDALVAEVNALAKEAVRDLSGVGAVERSAQNTAEGRPHEEPAAPAARPDAKQAARLQRIMGIEVPVIVQLAERRLPVSEILNLTTGAIIEFEKSVDSPLDLMINNKRIGRGTAVKVGENFGLRVGTIGSVRERLKAMGGRASGE